MTFSDRSRATGESRIYTAAKQMVESARQDTSHTFFQPKGERRRQHVVPPPALERCIIKACLREKKKKSRHGDSLFQHPSARQLIKSSFGGFVSVYYRSLSSLTLNLDHFCHRSSFLPHEPRQSPRACGQRERRAVTRRSASGWNTDR